MVKGLIAINVGGRANEKSDNVEGRQHRKNVRQGDFFEEDLIVMSCKGRTRSRYAPTRYPHSI